VESASWVSATSLAGNCLTSPEIESSGHSQQQPRRVEFWVSPIGLRVASGSLSRVRSGGLLGSTGLFGLRAHRNLSRWRPLVLSASTHGRSGLIFPISLPLRSVSLSLSPSISQSLPLSLDPSVSLSSLPLNLSISLGVQSARART
jgi:hypothetical protein